MGLYLLFGGELLIAAAIAFLAFSIRRERAQRGADADRQRALLDQSQRIALLGRRMPVQQRIDALWLCWSRGGRPDEALIGPAIAAIEEARSLFPAELGPEIEEAGRLLLDFLRQAEWQRQAVDCGRHEERIALMEREAELESLLRPKIAGLRTLLAEASRVPDSAEAG